MGFQISPGINVTEIDLTTVIPAVGTTVGAIAGPFRWGPANVPMLIDSELTLISTFGKPDNTTANNWFTAANFLSYANALQTVRVIREGGDGGHLNATADGSGILIPNENAYLNNFANGQGDVGMFAAKYPGDLGDSVAVSMADGASFGSWLYKTSFTSAPGTSPLVEAQGGSNDEVHVVVVDVLGQWTGTVGQVLEIYPFVSKCAAAKNEDGSTAYYAENLNRNSNYVWWMGHPTEEDLGIQTAVNWGSTDLTLDYDLISTKVTVVSVSGSFQVGETVADSAGAVVSTGSGAVLGTPVIGNGGILTIPVSAPGSGYVTPPTVVITGSNISAATAVAVLGSGGTAGQVISVSVTAPGSGYSGATATFSSGSGASATVTVTSNQVTGFSGLTGGINYTTAPTVSITGGAGTGATATCTVSGGAVTSITITAPGSGYTGTPTFVFTPVGSGATAGSIIYNTGKILSIPVSAGGSGYIVTPTITISGGGGSSATATATVGSGPTYAVTSITVTAGGSSYTTGVTAAVVPVGSGATASVNISATGRLISLTPTALGSGYQTSPAPTVTILGPGVGASVTAVVSGGQVVSYTVNSGGIGYTTTSATILSIDGPILELSPISGVFAPAMVLTGITSAATGTIASNGVAGGGIYGETNEDSSQVEGTANDVGGIYTTLTGGVDGNANIEDGDYQADTTGAPAGYALFRSGEDIDISLLLGADADQETAIYLINDIAEFRLDCVVFLSPPLDTVLDNAGNEATDIVAFRNTLPSSSYAVMDSGWKYMYDKYNDLYRWVPLNGDIAGLCVFTDDTRDPWWSPAGYNRGLIQNVVRLAWNPRQAYRDVLYAAGVNPVITDPGQGTLLFGDKTMLSKPSAFDRINVRRLFIVIEKAISTAAKFTLFEFNDQFTQAQFVNMVEPYLRQVQGRRGIFDFRVICDSTNNTPTVIDANQFVGDIYVKPARSINFIQLNFVAVSTGVDFNEVVGNFGA